MRALMTEEDIEIEMRRLVAEALQMAEARGLSTAGIGDRWTRDDGLDLNTDGQRVTRASVRAEAEKKNAEESAEAEMEDVL